jgi:hypothetical protein
MQLVDDVEPDVADVPYVGGRAISLLCKSTQPSHWCYQAAERNACC